MSFITDKVPVKNGADFTFICGKVPFAVTCSSQLPHADYNLIDLDLVNKMKIPLQKIKVSRFSIQGQTMRSVGFISQTVQCVRNGKISGNIHIQAKVIRDLYSLFDVDCVASAKTYTRLVGKKPPDDDTHEEDVMNIEDLEADDNEEDDAKQKLDDNSTCGEEYVINPNTASVETKENDDGDPESLSSIQQIHQPPPMTLKEWRKIPKFGQIRNVCVYETSPGDCSISDGDDDDTEDEDDDIKDDHEVHYQDESSNYGYREPEPGETFCNFCFVSGQPVRVTHSHNILDVSCPSMSHVDKERIHGPNWLAKMHGYND